MKTRLLIEQHMHGAFGIDFNKASVEEMIFVSKELLKLGIGGYFPTLVTDSVENIIRQTHIIKEASSLLTKDCAEILGIHLEGIFINVEKKGIHNYEHFLPLTQENFEQLEDDFIKIVTLAPELDEGLLDYLRSKDIKIQAGHCVGSNLDDCSGVTHLFNAMKGISHRGSSTALSALIQDRLYTEIIADGVHLSDDIIKLVFKSKPVNRIILISDALPITYSSKKAAVFADEKIYYDGTKATSANGTIAGSTTLLDKIVKILAKKDLFTVQLINNVYDYHNIEIDGDIEWDENFNIVHVRKGDYFAK
mgnify:FL=1